MIERDGFPVARSMARLAFLSIRPFVLVVFFVTGVTIHWGVLKGRCQMAFRTFHLDVLSHQWEA